METENETKDSNDFFLNLKRFEIQSIINKSYFIKLYKGELPYQLLTYYFQVKNCFISKFKIYFHIKLSSFYNCTKFSFYN